MTINFIDLTSSDFEFDKESVAEGVICAVLDYEHFPYEIEVNLTLTDDDDIRQMNKEYREIDASTDVLSFPMIDYPAPGDFSELADTLNFYINPDTEEVVLGDIVISVDHAKAQAQEYGHSVKREYAFLIVHSMLHLLGYDHMTEEDEVLMLSHQKAILDLAGIKREK